MTHLSPVTRWLFLFALASGLLVNLILASLGQKTVIDETGRFLRAVQWGDSWRPMSQAHAYLEEGHPVALYDWIFFEQRIKFIYPPTALLSFELLERSLPTSAWRTALSLFSWLLVAATAIFIALILERGLRGSPSSRLDRIARAALAVALTLTFYPVVKAYALGQAQVWVNALLAALVWSWVSERKVIAGVLVALMCSIKPQYGVVVVWGLLRREWSFAVAAMAASSVILAISVLSFGFDHHPNYLRVLFHISRLGEAYYPNQTVNGLLNRLLGNGVNLHWDPEVYPPYNAVVHAGTVVSSLALLGVALVWPIRRNQRGTPIDLCAMALAATMASPIAWEHHYGVLLPIYAYLLPHLLQRPVLGRPALFGLAATYVLASNFFPITNLLAHTPLNVVQSYLFAAALAVLVLLLVLRNQPAPADPPRVSRQGDCASG